MRTIVLLVSIILGWSAQASASCAGPALELLWSYPAQGEASVPVNAELWALVPYGWTQKTVRLDGQTLGVTAAFEAPGVVHVVPGELQAESDHTLQLEFADSQGTTESLTLAFRTGSTRAERPAAPIVERSFEKRETALGLNLSTCPDIIAAQDCYDTGPNALLLFETRGDKPLAWLVDGRLLPARCEDPQVYRHVSDPSQLCVALRAVGPGGLTSAAPQSCYSRYFPDNDAGPANAPRPPDASVPALPRDAAADDQGPSATTKAESCSAASSGSPGALLFSLLALLMNRRRSS
jgi:hypothetical protein